MRLLSQVNKVDEEGGIWAQCHRGSWTRWRLSITKQQEEASWPELGALHLPRALQPPGWGEQQHWPNAEGLPESERESFLLALKVVAVAIINSAHVDTITWTPGRTWKSKPDILS